MRRLPAYLESLLLEDLHALLRDALEQEDLYLALGEREGLPRRRKTLIQHWIAATGRHRRARLRRRARVVHRENAVRFRRRSVAACRHRCRFPAFFRSFVGFAFALLGGREGGRWMEKVKMKDSRPLVLVLRFASGARKRTVEGRKVRQVTAGGNLSCPAQSPLTVPVGR